MGVKEPTKVRQQFELPESAGEMGKHFAKLFREVSFSHKFDEPYLAIAVTVFPQSCCIISATCILAREISGKAYQL